MGEHEVELAAKFGLPEVGGFAAHLEGRYRGAWKSRGRRLTTAVQMVAAISQDELQRALEQRPEVRDALWRALNRATEVDDPDYINALGSVVAVVLDEARVDTASYLLAQLLSIEPIHLRCLIRSFEFALATPEEVRVVEGPEFANGFIKRRVDAGDGLARLWGIDPAMITPVKNQLEAVGLLSSETKTVAKREQRQTGPTTWAVQALRMLFPQLQHEGQFSLAGPTFLWPDGSRSSTTKRER